MRDDGRAMTSVPLRATQLQRNASIVWGALGLFLVVSFSAGLVGRFLSFRSWQGYLRAQAWYEWLEKPFFAPPPDWVFSPVWAVLCLLMGVSACLVWRKIGFGVPLALFGVQLVLNAAWPGLFFGLQSPLLAFLVILLLWLAVVPTTVLFFYASRTAGWLIVPYLAWVTFAAVLSGVIWWSNKGWAPSIDTPF